LLHAEMASDVGGRLAVPLLRAVGLRVGQALPLHHGGGTPCAAARLAAASSRLGSRASTTTTPQ
jgi:hypothetical protein